MKPAVVWSWAVPGVALAGLLVVWLLQLNQPLFLWLNGVSRYTGDGLWAHLTLWGDTLIVLAVLLPFAWRQRQWVWAALLASVLAALWTHIPKNLWSMPRPPAVLSADMFHVIGPRLTSGSFPSGHTTAIFTLAGLLVLGQLQKRSARLAVIAFAVLVGLSRIMVGAHWPQDVLAGALGGWLSAWLALRLAGSWQWPQRPLAQWLQHGFLLACTLALYVHESRYPGVLPMQYSIATLLIVAWIAEARRRPA